MLEDFFAGSGAGLRGFCVGGVFEEDVEIVAFVAGAAFVGERGALEVDERAFGVGEAVGGERDEAGAGEGVEIGVELLAVDAEGEVGVELAGGLCGSAVEGAEDGAELAVFLRSGVRKVCAVARSGEQKSQWPQGRRPSAVSPKCWTRADMRHCGDSAKATMRSIWLRRKASCVS